MHFDGQNWSNVALEAMGPIDPLNAIWGSSAGDIWAAGASATLLHRSGSQWEKIDTSQLITTTSSALFVAPG
jgi:hypothetical protein